MNDITSVAKIEIDEQNSTTPTVPIVPQREYQHQFPKLLKQQIAFLCLFILFFSLPVFANSGEILDESNIGIDEVVDPNLVVNPDEEGFLSKPPISNDQGVRFKKRGIIAYVVQGGDSLNKVAQTFHISLETIYNNNPDLRNQNYLRNNQILTIPPIENGYVYTIKSGDTLENLSTKYKTESQKITNQNKLDAKEKLVAGDIIVIPDAVIPQPPAPKRFIANKKTYGESPTYGGRDQGALPSRGTRFDWPCAGIVTQRYSYGHSGIDIAYTKGNHTTGIYAVAGGVVEKAAYGWNGGYGNMIIIDHGNGFKTLYGHNREIYVQAGQHVARGQMISWMGNSGRVYGRTGLHLHFEIRYQGRKVNPLAYL